MGKHDHRPGQTGTRVGGIHLTEVRVQLQLAETVVTLEKFHAAQTKPDGGETIALRTLEEMASGGRLPGAFRMTGSRIWWVNLLALMQQGIDVQSFAPGADSGREEENKPEKESTTPEKPPRKRISRQDRRPVVRPEAQEGIPRPLRYRQADKG